MRLRAVTRPAIALRAWDVLDGLCRALAAERPLSLLLTLSLLIASLWCASLLDIGFVLGTSAFWQNPHGVVGYGWADMPQTLSGYFFFQRDSWHIPLFHVAALGPPDGTSIIFTDSIPLVALAGRLLFQATGNPINLYGIWIVGCFAASSTAMTALTAALGQRSLAAAAVATLAGLCMPALLARWGHTSLMAQFEVPLALTFYLCNHQSSRPLQLFARAAALLMLALWTHAYLFAMVVPIVLATIVQAVLNQALGWRQAIGILVGLAALLGAMISISGYFESRGSLGTGAAGPFFSMNLLSPFMPQRSGLFPPFRDLVVDGTSLQYEGFSYLGGGTLLLLIATFQRQMHTLRRALTRHPCLGILLFGCTLFALSNEIYIGAAHILTIPLPAWVLELASIFRSDGRFFWPVMYLMTAMAIAAAIPVFGPRGVLLLVIAGSLQWIDSTPPRQAFGDSIHMPESPRIDLAMWEAAIARHDSLRLLPQYLCLPDRQAEAEIAIHLQLLAAVANRPINSVYASRFKPDCAADKRSDPMPRPGARQLSVFFGRFERYADMLALAEANGPCRAGDGIVVCSDIPGEPPRLAPLVETAAGGGRLGE